MNFLIKLSGGGSLIKILSDELSHLGIGSFLEKYQKNNDSFFDDGSTFLQNHNLSLRSGIVAESVSSDYSAISIKYSSYVDHNNLCVDFIYTLTSCFPSLKIECHYYGKEIAAMGHIAVRASKIEQFYCFKGAEDINNLLTEFLLSTKFYKSSSNIAYANKDLIISKESRSIHNSITSPFLEDIYCVDFKGKQKLYWLIDYDHVQNMAIDVVDPIINEHGVFEVAETGSWLKDLSAIKESCFSELVDFNTAEITLAIVNTDFAQEKYFESN
jgi:hypothetical protein